MTQRRSRTERAGKGADAARDRAAETPMSRFRSLARRLVNVPRQEFDEERRKHEKAKDDAPT
jgi:hypothetical protein